jgi:hypothetical protein
MIHFWRCSLFSFVFLLVGLLSGCFKDNDKHLLYSTVPEDETYANEDDDGFVGSADNCPAEYNPDQTDQDGDKIGDLCDNCPTTANSRQSDSNGDKIGDACDPAALDSAESTGSDSSSGTTSTDGSAGSAATPSE